MLKEKDIQRFWSKVDIKSNDECWHWKGIGLKGGNKSKKAFPYGKLIINGRYEGAHRISWIIHHGNIPDNLYILHKCDNPSCVNPNHLFPGTAKDNVHDRNNKHRVKYKKGEQCSWAKLTEQQVIKIRERAADGELHKDLAKEYKVKRTTVNDIAIGKKWKHVGGPRSRRKKIAYHFIAQLD